LHFISRIRRLVKILVDATAEGWDSSFFEGHMIAAGGKSVCVELVDEPCRLSPSNLNNS
jgi:hypothetical protein